MGRRHLIKSQPQRCISILCFQGGHKIPIKLCSSIKVWSVAVAKYAKKRYLNNPGLVKRYVRIKSFDIKLLSNSNILTLLVLLGLNRIKPINIIFIFFTFINIIIIIIVIIISIITLLLSLLWQLSWLQWWLY